MAERDRMVANRGDIAARSLEGKVDARRFVDGTLYEVAAAQAPLRGEPRLDALLDTEALKGERVMVYDSNEEGWSWGQLADDDYVGWLPTDSLRPVGARPTHIVSAVRTLVFPGPDFKLTPTETLSFGCKLQVARTHQDFAVTTDYGFVPLRHLADIGHRETDFVAVAERFLGTPYVWGGKTSLGIDCSGLLQIALASVGIAWPRDTFMQEPLAATIAPAGDLSNLVRGDLIFWNGHVAIVRDSATIIHANAYHMATAIEPIADAVARNRAAGSEVSSARRVTGLAQ